jgi:multidrug efflux pump subunit AcrA (membrane-fusion protein)
MILKALAPAAIVAAGVGSFLLFGRQDKEQPPSAVDRGVLVETAPVEKFSGQFTMQLDGIALPHRRIKLAAEVEGHITKKTDNARGGRHVAPGDPLFEIDPTDYQLAVERLKAQSLQSIEELAAVDVDIASTESLLSLATEDQELAERSLKRALELSNRNAISETELDDAKRQELVSRNSLQTLRNQLSMLKQKRRTQLAATQLVAVQLKQAETDLARTSITSPISGSVVTDTVEIDDHVRVGDVLIELSDNSQMEIRCSLTIDQLFWIWLAGGTIGPNQAQLFNEPTSAQVRPDLLPNPDQPPLISQNERLEIPPLPVFIVYEFGGQQVAWDGVLSRYEGSGLDAQTRTVPCRILVSQPTQARARVDESTSGAQAIAPPRLFSGMYVDIEIPIAAPVPLLELPLEAIRPGNSGRNVWVIREGVLNIVPVEVARVERAHALIHATRAELQVGDLVVVSPLASVTDGMQVRTETDDPFTDAEPPPDAGLKDSANDAAEDNSAAGGLPEAVNP